MLFQSINKKDKIVGDKIIDPSTKQSVPFTLGLMKKANARKLLTIFVAMPQGKAIFWREIVTHIAGKIQNFAMKMKMVEKTMMMTMKSVFYNQYILGKKRRKVKVLY